MPAKTYPVPAIGSYQFLTVPFSLDTNEQGTYKLKSLPYRCRLISVATVLYKAAGASDDGTVVLKKGSTTLATVTIAASSAIGDEDAAPSVTDTPFETSDQISITTAKTTAGGKGVLMLTLEVLPSH
jgi:hypothetical protein